MRGLRNLTVVAACICLPPKAVYAEIRENLQYNYYGVDLENSKETLFYAPKYAKRYAGLSKPKKGPVFLGTTSKKISWKLHTQEMGKVCGVRGIEITLDIEVSLPQLVNVPPEKNEEFQKSMQPLREHELGHVDIIRVAVQQIEREVLALRSSGCEDIVAHVRQIVDRVRIQEKAVHARYDQVTRHGQTHVTW